MPFYLQSDDVNDRVEIPGFGNFAVSGDLQFNIEFKSFTTSSGVAVILTNSDFTDYIFLRGATNQIDFRRFSVNHTFSISDATDENVVYRIEGRFNGGTRTITLFEAGVSVGSFTVSNIAFPLFDFICGNTIASGLTRLKYLSIENPLNPSQNRYYENTTGTGSILPDTVGGEDGTLINFPGDDSQWVSYGGGPVTQSITTAATASTSAVFNPTISLGAINISPNATESTEQVFSPVLSQGFDISPTSIASTSIAYSVLSVNPRPVNISPLSIASSSIVYTPVVSLAGAIEPSFTPSTSIVYSPVVALRDVSIDVTFILSGDQVFNPNITQTNPLVAPTLASTKVLIGTVGSPFAHVLTIESGGEPDAWQLTGGADQLSYSLDNAGLLTRDVINNIEESEVVTVTASNAAGTSNTQTVTIIYSVAQGTLLVSDATTPVTNVQAGLPYDNGRLAVDSVSAISHVSNGLNYAENQRICVSIGAAVAYEASGLPFTADGRLAMSTAETTYYANGLPFTVDSQISVDIS